MALVVTACGSDDPAGTEDTVASTVVDSTTSSVDTTTTTASIDQDALRAQEGDNVAVHYVGTLDDGTEFDASRPRGATLDFVVGGGRMIPGFDRAVRGMVEGEVKTVRLEPADAYGEFDPELLLEVSLSQVPEGTEAGDVLVDPTTGRPVPVVSVEGEVVTIDLNHDLAGEFLTFEIEMVTIMRDAETTTP